MFASQPEVLAYWEALIAKHNLAGIFRYNAEFIGSVWDADEQHHAIRIRDTTTGAEEMIRANVLVSAAGPLRAPRLPNLPGSDSFDGPSFHNLRWDPSVELEGRRVAVIGNGSSGIQLVVSQGCAGCALLSVTLLTSSPASLHSQA